MNSKNDEKPTEPSTGRKIPEAEGEDPKPVALVSAPRDGDVNDGSSDDDYGSDCVFGDDLDDVPRDPARLCGLSRLDLRVLAYRVGLTKNPEAMRIWRGTVRHEDHARQVQEGLAAWDVAQSEAAHGTHSSATLGQAPESATGTGASASASPAHPAGEVRHERA